MVDGRLLVAWLRARASGAVPLVGAVYQGLADRVARGDFDLEGGERNGD